MKKVLNIIIKLLEVIVIVFVIAITTLLLTQNKYGVSEIFGKSLVIVNKDNVDNLKNFNRGELVLLNQVDAKDISLKDEVYYYATINNKYVLKTGVVKNISGDATGAFYELEGDDNETISKERILGKYSGTSYKNVGGVLELLESRVGFLLLVILPVMLVFIYEIYGLVLMIKEDKELENRLKSEKNKKEEIEVL